jgi:hypothetical protein
MELPFPRDLAPVWVKKDVQVILVAPTRRREERLHEYNSPRLQQLAGLPRLEMCCEYREVDQARANR